MEARNLVAAILVTAVAMPAMHAQATAAKSLGKCQKAVAVQSGRYVRATTDAVGKCLAAISTAVVKNGHAAAQAAETSASACVAAFGKIRNSDDPAATFQARFEAKIGAKCDPAANPALKHVESATYTIGDATLGAARLSQYCAELGGDGTLDSFAEWRSCLHAASDAQAHEAIAVRWPRALEYFEALQPALAALPPSNPTNDAVAVLSELDAAIEGPIEDNLPDPPSGSTGLLATGMTVCEFGFGGSAPCPAGSISQDAIARAGFQPQYRDNGDGTITDLITGLTWEKLGSDGTIHDSLAAYSFEDAVTVKIATLNAGDGFAGHSDWRLPNRRELESLVDSGRDHPPVPPDFTAGCTPGCSALDCSCTATAPYWSSTSYQADASQHWTLDFLSGRLVRSSAATAHVRAVRGGTTAAPAAAPSPNPPRSLSACQQAVAMESRKYIAGLGTTVGKCLNAMTAGVIQKGATTAQAAQRSARTCVASFARLANSSETDAELGAAFVAAIAAKCDPASNPGLLHLDADTYAVGDRTLSAAQLGSYCAALGGDGAIDSFAKWAKCLRRAAEGQADEAIALRWPRSLEFFAALRTHLAALPASDKVTDALAALTAVDARIEGAIDDDAPDLPAAAPAGLLVTGQTQCVQDDASMGECPGGLPQQDGAVRAGIARSYTDNGDGTITDNVTGLMWEKLSDDDSIHDRDHDYNGIGSYLNKIARLKRHSFAGYQDWRLPNSRELESLVDAGRTAPAIDPIFDNACTPGCTILDCSCTSLERHMTSTWRNPPDGGYVAVDFTDGSSMFYPGRRVRAVRAGNQPPHTAVDRAPVAWNINFQWPNGEECIPVTLMGTDDSDVTLVRISTFPQNGFLTEFIAQIPAAQPDLYIYWGPTDNSFEDEGFYQMFPTSIPPNFTPPTPLLPRGRLTKTFCYVTFSPTFVGTDSFGYELVDNEGNVSNEALANLTIFEEP